MGNGWLVYELKRDDRRVHCSSFAVAAALLDLGWTLNNWGEWKQFRATRFVDGSSAEPTAGRARLTEVSRPEPRDAVEAKDRESQPASRKL
jgi:hypothetical protein